MNNFPWAHPSFIHIIRTVGQSWVSSVWSTTKSLLFTAPLVLRHMPDMVCLFFPTSWRWYLRQYVIYVDHLQWAWGLHSSLLSGLYSPSLLH